MGHVVLLPVTGVPDSFGSGCSTLGGSFSLQGSSSSKTDFYKTKLLFGRAAWTGTGALLSTVLTGTRGFSSGLSSACYWSVYSLLLPTGGGIGQCILRDTCWSLKNPELVSEEASGASSCTQHLTIT